MAKTPQILQLEPNNELRFKGPFTDVVTAELKLINPSRSRICFKVKTTAPKQYCVRPNNGLIDPGASVIVAVMLQPFDYDPNEKNRHKFLVQSLVVPDGPVANQEQWWKDAPPEQVMDSKLKCVFDLSPDLIQKLSSKTELQLAKGRYESAEPVLVDDEFKREIQLLREENAALKTESSKLRKLVNGSSSTSTSLDAKHFLQTAASSSGPFSIVTVVVLIVAIVTGIIVGKFLP
jgi:hypothetical protein